MKNYNVTINIVELLKHEIDNTNNFIASDDFIPEPSNVLNFLINKFNIKLDNPNTDFTDIINQYNQTYP